jgi:hypothetical protein
MLDILDKYDSLLSLVKNSQEYDSDLYEDLINFLYAREQKIQEEIEEEAMIETWIESEWTEEDTSKLKRALEEIKALKK